jgi:hypothetical protein
MASDDPVLLLVTPARISRRTDLQVASAFDKRALTCEWVYECLDAVTYAAYIFANQIVAAAITVGSYLRAGDQAGICCYL